MTEDAQHGRAGDIEAILSMVPPSLGGRERAERNLHALTSGELAAMRADLEGAMAALPQRRAAPAAGKARRLAARGKLLRGLDRLQAATAAIRASREGVPRKGG